MVFAFLSLQPPFLEGRDPNTAGLRSHLASPVFARWVASREEEQAVSVKMHGPVRPKVKDTLPTKKGAVLPVLAAAAVACKPSCGSRPTYSAAHIHPT